MPIQTYLGRTTQETKHLLIEEVEQYSELEHRKYGTVRNNFDLPLSRDGPIQRVSYALSFRRPNQV